jgi:hypothetical protein
MGWIEKLAPFRKGGAAVAEAIREEELNGSGKNGPPLMCLVNDASGRASFKTHVFPDSESATDFVLYWFPNQADGGIIAFWAMTFEPVLDSSLDTVAEPLVMVRDVTRDGVVYLFSFSDLDSAQAFLRDEVQHGTDLGSMMLYWAVPVRMVPDQWGKMRLTPAVPPGTVQELEFEAPSSDMWTLPTAPLTPETEEQEPAEDSRKIFEEAPNAYTGVARPDSAADETFELTAWMERARRKPSADNEGPRSPRAAKARLARANARLEPPPVDDEILWPEHPSRDVQPAFTPMPVIEEEPVQTSASYVSLEPMPFVEDVPTFSQADETRLTPTPVRAIEDEPLPIAEPEPVAEPKLAPDFVEALAEEPVVLEAVVDVPAPLAPVFEEAAVTPEEQPEVLADEPSVFEAVVQEPTPLAPVFEEVAVTPEGQPEVRQEAGLEETEIQVDVPTIRVQTNGHQSDTGKHDNGYITLEPAEIVVHQNGHSAKPSEVDSAAAQEPAAEAEAKVVAHADDVDHGVDIRIEIHLNSSRAMKVKRWEAKADPFEGFNSPPGRF